MNINIENEQQRITSLLDALERDNKSRAREILTDMKKQAYSKQYQLRKDIEHNKYLGAELEVAKSELKSAEKSFTIISDAVDVVRAYMKDKQHIRIKGAINRLNIEEGKRIATIEKNVQTQTRVIERKTTEKLEILVQRLIYQNKLYKLDENTIDRLTQTFYKIGVNFKQSIFNIFNKPKHFDSGDEHEALLEIFTDYSQATKITTLSDSDRIEVINALDEFRRAISV